MGHDRLAAMGAFGALLLACAPDPAPPTGEIPEVGGGGAGGGDVIAAVGAALACGPGERLDETGCVAPGVPEDACGSGFVADGARGCEPVLPPEVCGAGETGRLGTTSCAPVGSCGLGTWGDIVVEPGTQHVDGAFQGTSNGSAAQPWKTIAQAVSAAAPGAIVAIAAGSYAGAVTLDRSVRLWGRCADLVHLTSGDFATIAVQASPVEMRGFSVTGPTIGIDVFGAHEVTVEDVIVHDLGYDGLSAIQTAAGAPHVTVKRTLFSNVSGTSVYGVGAHLVIEDSELRHEGEGSAIYVGPGAASKSDVSLRRVVVRGSEQTGIWAHASDLRVDESYVVDTGPSLLDQEFGIGIYLSGDPAAQGSLVLDRSVVQGARHGGVWISESSFVMTRSVVRDVGASLGADLGGWGVHATSGGTGMPITGRLERSLVERTVRGGVSLEGVEGSLSSIIVRDVEPDVEGNYGRGLGIETDGVISPHVTAEGLLVERVHEIGILVLGARADISQAAVRDTRANSYGFGVGVVFQIALDTFAPASGTVNQLLIENAFGGGLGVAGATVAADHVVVRGIAPLEGTEEFGDGIAATGYLLYPMIFETSLSLDRATVEDSSRAGVAAFAATIELGASEVLCNPIPLDAEEVLEQAASFENRGDNVCGCDEETACKVVSSNLSPPLSGAL